MTESLINKIISIIPSKTVREEIEKQNWGFSDMEYAGIVFHLAESIELRNDLLSQIIDETDDETLKDQITKRFETDRTFFERFAENNGEYYYLLAFKSVIGNWDVLSQWGNKVICKTYEDCLKIADLSRFKFKSESKDENNCIDDYIIEKHKIFNSLDDYNGTFNGKIDYSKIWIGDAYAEIETTNSRKKFFYRMHNEDLILEDWSKGDTLDFYDTCRNKHFERLYPVIPVCFKNGDKVRVLPSRINEEEITGYVLIDTKHFEERRKRLLDRTDRIWEHLEFGDFLHEGVPILHDDRIFSRNPFYVEKISGGEE